jgi:SAM-dependent methyltransferase
MKVQKPLKGENRTIEQLRAHYEIERDLANRLRNASRQERRYLYSSLYDELYKRVPLHPQLTRKASPRETELAVSAQIQFIKPFLGKDIAFLEVGPGDCALSFEAAKSASKVYAVDVSDKITESVARPPNFHLILSDGSSIPLPPNSVNLAYSNHLIEHLHPDDTFEQLENIFQAMAPSGICICITPNRLSGPHDISRYFDQVATGFHLKEYSILELSSLFRKVGFSRVRIYIGVKGKYAGLPAFPIVLCETLLGMLPYALRKIIMRIQPFRLLNEIRMIGIKQRGSRKSCQI